MNSVFHINDGTSLEEDDDRHLMLGDFILDFNASDSEVDFDEGIGQTPSDFGDLVGFGTEAHFVAKNIFDNSYDNNKIIINSRGGGGGGGRDIDDDGLDTLTKKRKKKQSNGDGDFSNYRRLKNKEHAKRSRLKKKAMHNSLDTSLSALETENENLKRKIREKLQTRANALLSFLEPQSHDKQLTEAKEDSTLLHNNDFRLLLSLKDTNQNFCISDPFIQGNPIVFASQGFLDMSGYTREEIYNKNCRFLQGPKTSLDTVAKISAGIRGEYETVSLILNYKKDGTTFWNKLYLTPLKDANGTTVNYLGIQCDVTSEQLKYSNQMNNTTDNLIGGDKIGL